MTSNYITEDLRCFANKVVKLKYLALEILVLRLKETNFLKSLLLRK